jgi:rpsU-divergently transcribed protein
MNKLKILFFLFWQFFSGLQKLATNRQLPALCYSHLSSSSPDTSHALPSCSIAIRNYSSSSSTNKPTDPADNLDDFRAREEKKEEAFNKEYKTTDHQDSGGKNDAEDPAAQAVKMKILEAALPFVGEHGWTRQALTKGAEHINYPGVAHGIFPKGGFELIQYFFTKCNRALVDEMRRETDGIEKVANPSEFAEKAIRIRLQMIEPYLATWPQALGMMSLPPNAPSAIANMLTLADDICYYAGDRSVDVSRTLKYFFLSFLGMQKFSPNFFQDFCLIIG